MSLQQKNERIYTSALLYAFRACAGTLLLPLHSNSNRSPTNCFWISDPCCNLRYSSYIHLSNPSVARSVGRTMQTKRKGMPRCGTAFSCHGTRENTGHRAVSASRFWMPIITDVHTHRSGVKKAQGIWLHELQTPHIDLYTVQYGQKQQAPSARTNCQPITLSAKHALCCCC